MKIHKSKKLLTTSALFAAALSVMAASCMYNQVVQPYIDYDSVSNQCELFNVCSRFTYGSRDLCFGPDNSHDCFYKNPEFTVWTVQFYEEASCAGTGICGENWVTAADPQPDWYLARETVTGCAGS